MEDGGTSPLEYIPSSRQGHNYLAINGFLYLKDKQNGSKIIWKCKEFQKLRCKARIHVQEDCVVKVGVFC